MDVTTMTSAEIVNELEARLAADLEGMSPEDVTAHDERVSALTDELNKRNAAAAQRDAAAEAARNAIEAGNATRINSTTMTRSRIEDVTDYSKYERTAYFKDLAQRSGLIIPNMEMTTVERAAFTHLTSNTGAAVPVETQNQIISLIDSSAVLFGDVSRDNFEHVYEIVRHKAIAAGDAAKTNEGAAPANEEQNTFDTIAINGDEIKKTVKMSRRMEIQSIDAFAQYIVKETAARLSYAAECNIIDTLDDATLGIAAANKIPVTGALTKAKVVEAFGKIKTFNNPAPKGCNVYANSNTIWNNIAMVEDGENRSYFVENESVSDPTIQGRIFGKVVKQDDALEDGVILIGYPDLFKSNLFGGIDVTPYVEGGTQNRCWDGYMLYGGALAVPVAFAKIVISA